jgi:hypothetical protein
MNYRYTRAFIAEGTLAFSDKSQEITLFDEPREGLKFVLTNAPDSFLIDADKTAAVGLITSSKWSVAGFPPPSPAKPPGVVAHEIRSNRKELLNRRMVLVCQFDGTADPLKNAARSVVEGDTFSFLNRGDIDKITSKHEKEIDRAIASLYAADPLVVRFEPLAESFRFTAPEGVETLAVTLSVTASSVSRTGIDFEKEIKLKTEFVRCFRSEADLSKVARLLSDSLLAKEDKLRSFLAAWTSLEIFVHKFYTQPSATLVEESTTCKRDPFLVFQFQSAAKNLELEDPEVREVSFKKIKNIRDDLIHGKKVDESSFPIEETQALIRAFLEKVQ